MRSQVFQIEHLRASGIQRLQQAAFAASGGAANHLKVETGGHVFQIGNDGPPVGLVAAVELRGLEADLLQNMRHRSAAVSATPAIDQRLVASRFVLEMPFQVVGDMPGNQGRAHFLGVKGGSLFVQGADTRAFLVIEYRQIDRAGNMVFLEFRGCACIDDFGIFRQVCYGCDARWFHENKLMSIRLTELSHGGGCGCKIAPSVLQEILSQSAPMSGFADLLVGTESSDDAAVYRLNDSQAIVATTDFFMPIVDDPFDFGRIAATNALSDIYAMGGKPLFALAIVGMPVGKLPPEIIRKILAGGESVCTAAGIPIAGGHSIDAPEPIYGLVGIGVVHPDKVKRNNQARPGDVLILAKPLGVGVFADAMKKGQLDDAGYAQMLASTTQLNTPGIALAGMVGVHAITDVTGFGLLGHLLEICRGSGLAAEIRFDSLPVHPIALELAQRGFSPGASERNWASFGHEVSLPEDMVDWQRKLLCDPQTSGGLLVACEPGMAPEVLNLMQTEGFAHAGVIGGMGEGKGVVVTL